MIALQEFADGAVSDGGLNIDIWTGKGRDEDALVFTDGEIIQLYFRVNHTVPKYIDGELYQVFGSLKDVVANTRGLGRRQSPTGETIRVGEAMLTITTMEE